MAAIEVPALLLKAPLPTPPPPKTPIMRADELRGEYFATVTSFLDAEKPAVEEVVAAVNFAMWIFNCQNFTGPVSKGEIERSRHLALLLDRATYSDDPIAQRETLKLLISDGEVPSPVVSCVSLLLFSLAAVRCEAYFPVSSIWRLRVIFRHQLCLAHRSHSLLMELATTIDAIAMHPENGGEDPLMLVEIAHVQSYYRRFDEVGSTVFRAVDLSKIELRESSILGVRTRWQKIPYMQSLMVAKSAVPFDAERDVPAVLRDFPPPTTIKGYDQGHDLYDRPRADTECGVDTDDVVALHPTDKALILALCHNIRNMNPAHGLTIHKMQIYIERLMVDPGPQIWALRAMQLLIRARLEQRRNRVQERAFLQLQELVDQFANTNSIDGGSAPHPQQQQPTMARCHPAFFYSVAYPSIWELKQEFAGWCFEDNLFKTALDIFEQIQDWANIIECCAKLDRRKKAESLVRDLLKDDPENPVLLVALGDATREDQYLWQAWELSGHKMAAPMRSLAKLALDREHYDKVVEYFDIAVSINPVFGGDWFALGFASLKLQNLERSCEAFTRVCMMDPNNAYAWNNLGSVLMRRGQMRPAFNALSQALRNNRRNWRMWYNYFTLGVELLEVSETTHALSIVLEIAHRQCPIEGKALHRFVENAIRFVKGEISARPTEQELGEASWIKHHRHGKLVETEDDEKRHFDDDYEPVDTATDGEVEVVADLAPLGADVEMPEHFFPEKAAEKAAQEAEERRRMGQRYIERVRKLFLQITDIFVQDVEIWAAYATLLRFLDGPRAAYEIRLKEVRTSQQADQWERRDEPFERAVAALVALFDDANDAGDAEALTYTLSQIDAALEITQEHMEAHAAYRKLQALRMKANKSVKAAASKAGDRKSVV